MQLSCSRADAEAVHSTPLHSDLVSVHALTHTSPHSAFPSALLHCNTTRYRQRHQSSSSSSSSQARPTFCISCGFRNGSFSLPLALLSAAVAPWTCCLPLLPHLTALHCTALPLTNSAPRVLLGDSSGQLDLNRHWQALPLSASLVPPLELPWAHCRPEGSDDDDDNHHHRHHHHHHYYPVIPRIPGRPQEPKAASTQLP